MAAKERNEKEAAELAKKADKRDPYVSDLLCFLSLKTSLFGLKFSPDYDSAADYYSKAALSMKAAENVPGCIDMHLKAAECYEKNNSRFHAARALESAAGLYNTQKEYDKMLELILKAVDLNCQSGAHDAALTALERTAKQLEFDRPRDTASLLQKAAKIALIADKPIQRIGFLEKSAHCHAKAGDWERATELLKEMLEDAKQNNEQNSTAVPRAVLALVVLGLRNGDYVAGRKCYENGLQFSSFNGTQAGNAAIELLNAFDEKDADALKRALNNPHFRNNVDAAYYKLAQTISVPGRPAAASASEQRFAATNTTASSAETGAEVSEELDLT